MKGELLRPRPERVFADDEPLFCDLALEGGVRGGVVDVQAAGQHADEAACGQGAVDGGAVAPFRNPRDDGKPPGKFGCDVPARLFRPGGQDAGADDAELSCREQFPSACTEEREGRIGNGAQRLRIAGARERDGKDVEALHAPENGVRRRRKIRAVTFIYPVPVRLYHRRANFFQFAARKSPRTGAGKGAAGAFIQIRRGGEQDKKAFLRRIGGHSRLSPRR